MLYPRGSFCLTDCDGDGQVDVTELVTATGMALGERPLQACPSADDDLDGRVYVDEILRGVGNVLVGCSSGSAATGESRGNIRFSIDAKPRLATIRCGFP
ncbi:hypothetical protein L6Q96_20570 [Candidatus Binatia bacterium]|nr:hypothetical protein [Candidatus Binatia bacterium]